MYAYPHGLHLLRKILPKMSRNNMSRLRRKTVTRNKHGCLSCCDNRHFDGASCWVAVLPVEDELSRGCIMSLIRPCRGVWTLVTTRARRLGKQIYSNPTARDKCGCTRTSLQWEWWRSLLVCVCVCHVKLSIRAAVFGMLPVASFYPSQRWMNSGVKVLQLPWVLLPPLL